MISQKDLHALMEHEFATTIKVMKAYPEDKPEYTPHERSGTALQIMRTFVLEMFLFRRGLGDEVGPDVFKNYDPKDIPTIVSDFEKLSDEVLSRLEKLSPEDYARTIPFAGKEWQAGDFMFHMLLDQIHHRGQLSTYIRPSGGKVPSIYGTSADDKNINL